jgi:hypothetical protein
MTTKQIYIQNNKSRHYGGARKKKTATTTTQRRKSGTRKNRNLETQIIRRLLEMLNLVHIFHWKTLSYPIHKATDMLYSKLNEHIDTYVEILIGKTNVRLNMNDFDCLKITMSMMKRKNIDDVSQLYHIVSSFIRELIVFHRKFDYELDTDLFNIRDEIIGDLNQFLYLLRLR